MEIRVKYNDDLAFRRETAFRRMYLAKNFKRRLGIELGLMAAAILGAAAVVLFARDVKYSSYVFYALAILAVILLARFLRALVVRRRIKPGDASRANREFVFGEDGFQFGPMNEAGEMLETRWRDVDKVYLTENVAYLLCMGRRHWAAVDRRLLVEGSWEDLLKLLRDSLPARRIAG